MRFLSLSSWLLIFIVVLELCLDGYLALSHRIPIGHEGLNYFLSQYFFLNGTVFGGHIPQWIPFMGHGTMGSIWFASQDSMGQNLLFPWAQFLKAIPFDSVFYFNIFIDHLVLIVGAWLLSGRYYKSPWTRFFVVTSLTGSAIWATQTWFNFHFYHFLPLIFYFLHKFHETGKWRYFLGVGNLFAFQTLGNAAYFPPVIGLTIFLYIVTCLCFDVPKLDSKFLGQDKVKGFLSLSFVLLGFVLAVGVLMAGNNELMHYSFGRDSNNIVPLDGFLNHGGNLTFNKWLELIVGLSPALDYTLYFGVLAFILFLIGIKESFQKPYRHLIITVVFLLLVSVGSFIAVMVYYGWPLMKLYRHLALISPIIKMFMLFIAGLGFEKFLFSLRDKNKEFISWIRWIGLSLLLIISLMVFTSIFLEGGMQRILHFIVNPGGLYFEGKTVHLIPGLPILPHNETYLLMRLLKTLVVLLLFYLVLSFNSSKFKIILFFFLVLHVYDVYEYKYFETNRRTVVIPETYEKFLHFSNPSYQYRRSKEMVSNNPRSSFLFQFPSSNGSRNAIYNAYTFSDELGSTFLVDYLQGGFDLYLRAINQQDFKDRQMPPEGLIPYKGFQFPMDHQAALKMSGFSKDKIQFFGHAAIFDDEKSVFEILGQKDFIGDVPLLINQDKLWRSIDSLDMNSRIKADYRITSYNTDRLEFDFNLSEPAWVYVSQNFSQYWHCSVDGKLVSILPANLAYQAFAAQKGKHHAVMWFSNPRMEVQQFFWIIISYVWLFILMGYLYSIIIRGYLG